MAKSTFISLFAVENIVRKVEGTISYGGILNGIAYDFVGQTVNDSLNLCDHEGYELFDTEISGNSKIYRMKLRAR